MSITAEQAIDIARSQAVTAGVTVDTLSFKSITRDLKHPHLNPVGIFAWAKVTPEEEKNDWIIYTFPMDPSIRGNITIYVINKETGAIERTLYGD